MSKQANSKFVVAKFGGTSVRDSLAIKNCVEIVKSLPEVKVVVVSATSQTTNHLERVIGPNGAGKTTLFKLLTDQEKPDNGSLKVGETVKLVYVDQGRELDPSKSILDVISGGTEHIKMGSREINSRAYISRFNFTGDDHNKKVTELSGGERNRVHLASMLKEEGNVLLLDEPTNDLDVNTLRALEKALMDYSGCAVVISHDRYFLDRIATHILAFEGDSKVVWFDGNFSEYEEDKRKRLGDDALRPRRIAYKKLKRD